MANEPQRFLEMLSGLPAYKDFFDFVRGAVAQAEGKGTTAAAPAQTVDPTAGMPEPDEELPDGSKVYSMEGLKALMEWNSQQTEARVSSKYESALKQLEERYKPVENEWRERQRIEQTLPVIRKQIEEARTWMLFNENEQEIIAALKADPRISLEGAYRQVVFPKLIAERNQMRQDVIKEVKAAPVSSSVTSRVTTRPGAPASGEPRSLTDIIKEQIDSLKR